MAKETTLDAQKRDGTGKGVARKLRASGRVPAVVYGRDLDAVHISLDAHDAELLFRSISVDNTIVDLAVDGEKEPYETLVREIQMHPYKASILHVDFLRIQKGVMVDVNIPVELIGSSVGVRNSGGILEQVLHELEVRCIPSKIPEVIEVDISALEIGDSIHVSDIVVDDDFEILADEVQTVCMVSAPRVEEEPEDEDEAVDEDAPADADETDEDED